MDYLVKAIFLDQQLLLRIAAWIRLGWYDIRSKYRRTFLGPLWIALTTGFSVGCLGFVYGSLFQIQWRSYLPYVTAGLICWILISTLLLECNTAFIMYKHVFHSFKLEPILPHIRIVFRVHMEFIHNLLVFIAVAIVCNTSIGPTQLLMLPAFTVYLINGLCFGFLFSLLCARFRDIQQLFSALISVLFLVTPILWYPDMLGERGNIAQFNPLTHYIAILREPMLGQFPPKISWLIVALLTTFSILITMLVYKKIRNKVIFWL